MTRSFTRRLAPLALGTLGTIALSTALSGCGGPPTDSGEAVVVPEPNAAIPTAGAPAATPAPATAATPVPAAPAPATTAAASPASPVKAEGWGTLKGKIVFGSNAPASGDLVEKGKAPKDPEVCAKEGSIKSERLVVDATSKGVKYALVYLPKPTAVNDKAKAAASKADVIFDQAKCVFEPHVLGVMAGAKITLKSSDPVNHNVNAKLQKNSPFNSILASGNSTNFSPTTSERAPVPVTCDIHPWMQAWWMVLDNPYFAVTDKDGNFEIKNVPAGTQKVVVWQEATSFVTAPSGEDVTIKAGEPTSKDFTLDPAKVKPAR